MLLFRVQFRPNRANSCCVDEEVKK